MSEAITSFGSWLRRRRKALDLTQDDLASAVGCSKELIAKIEQDARRPSKQVADLLARALQIDVADQTLFVRAARAELATDQLPSPMVGVPQPQLRIPAIGSARTPAEDPAPSPRRTNLPAQQNALIGRTHETATVTALLETARLVTLTGPGGTGKTRLALQIAAEMMDQYVDGVWFIDLSPISEGESIVGTCTQALSIPDLPGQSREERLHDWLRNRQTLLVLDNCEQVIDSVAAFAGQLLRENDTLTILATSRIPLRVVAEQEYPVAPLALPDASTLPPLDQLSQYDAVALFIARARGVRPDFAVTNANAPAVAAICAQLDGMPLAIELAAARIRTFSPDQLLSRLAAAQLQTLVGGARDLPARQQTIRATIDWSYRLLTPPQQILLARLGVFVGGWSLEAAEAVCGDPDLDPATELEALVAQSLIRISDQHGVLRYMMLETIRAYALERLAELGDEQLPYARHANYYVAFAEQAEPRLQSADQREWLGRLDAEYENARAVLDRTLTAHDLSLERRILGLRLVVALWYYWSLRGRLIEGLAWCQHNAGYSSDLPRQLQVRLRLREAWLQRLSYGINSTAAEQLAEEGLQLAHELHDDQSILMARIVMAQNAPYAYRPQDIAAGLALAQTSASAWWRAHALLAFSRVEYQHNAADVDAQRTAAVGLALARESGDPWLLAWALSTRALLLSSFDSQARVLLEEALTVARANENWLGVALASQRLGGIARTQGDYIAARDWQHQRLAAERLNSNLPGIIAALSGLGELMHHTGDLQEAEGIAKELLALAPLGQHQRSVQGAALAVRIFLDRGEYVRARSLADQAIAVTQSHGDFLELGVLLWLSGYACTVSGDLVQAERHAQDLLHHAQQQNIVHQRGMALEIFGMIALRRRNIARARTVLEECRALRKSLGDSEAINVVWTTLQLSCTALAGGDTAQAQALLLLCLQYHRRTPFMVDLPLLLEMSATLCFEQHATEAALRLWGAAEVLREQIGAPMWPVDRPEYERRVAEARAQLSPEAWDAAWADGRALTWEQAVDEAIAWLAKSQESAT